MSLKRIANLLRQDLTNALRDNMLLYMMFGPLLLAFGARLLLPSLDQTSLTFAVQSGASPALIQRLESIGKVELLRDAAAVRARVLRSDDAFGVYLREGQPVLLSEGNEGDNPAELAALAAFVAGGQETAGASAPAFTRTIRSTERSLVAEYTTIIFIMIALLLGALVMAFNMIEDKETRAVKALGVSPLSMLELTAARGLFALLLSMALMLAVTFILAGTSVSYPLLAAAFFFSMGLPVLTGYLIGGLADNQLKAIALLKFYMLVYLTLPIVSIFVPLGWHFLFYPLPNYWMWKTFENVLIGQTGPAGFLVSGAITLAASLALVLLLAPFLRRQLSLR